MHLDQLLTDATELDTIHTQLRTGLPGRQYGLASLNRAAIVISVSAWESYVEELMRESLMALRPAAPPLGNWPALSAFILGELGRFNTPDAQREPAGRAASALSRGCATGSGAQRGFSGGVDAEARFFVSAATRRASADV